MPRQVKSIPPGTATPIIVESLRVTVLAVAAGKVSIEITRIAPTIWIKTTTERATRQSKKIYSFFVPE